MLFQYAAAQVTLQRTAGKGKHRKGRSKNRHRDRESATTPARGAYLAMKHDGILVPLSASKVVQEPAW